jgi:hypothetical protein
MRTPFDGKILLVNWKARNTPGVSIDDCARLITEEMPNVAGIMLKCSNGALWQGELNDFGPQAVTGVDRIGDWVETFAGHGLEVHTWGVPRAKRQIGQAPDLAGEAEKIILAGQVEGVKSVSLDVEHGRFYWLGTASEATELMTLIRQGLPPPMHVAMILDGRPNRPFQQYVDPWLPFVDSLHPMVYPIMFGRHKTIEEHLDLTFNLLEPYGKPLVPMLQSVAEIGGRPTSEEIVTQGEASFAKGAAGISFFRLGSDAWSGDGLPFMGQPEYGAVAQIRLPETTTLADYSWYDVIRATDGIARDSDGDWRAWFAQAGVWSAFSQFLKDNGYNGPPLGDWPLADDTREHLLIWLDEQSDGGPGDDDSVRDLPPSD